MEYNDLLVAVSANDRISSFTFRIPNIKAFFLIGIPVKLNNISQLELDIDTQNQIELENIQYKDVLQV